MPVDNSSPIEISAFAWVPHFARGFVRDLRVRWALEEVGLSYRVQLIGGAGGVPGGQARPETYLGDQPFGQVPVYREGALCLFETGAIVMHIGAKDERLLPREEPGRARAISWMIAALNSIEPQSSTLATLTFFCGDASWSAEAGAAVSPFLEKRLAQLATALRGKEWLDDRFTIGDLMMIDVLRAIPDKRLVAAHPNLASYVARGTARSAFRRAMDAQLADFVPETATA